MIRHAKSSWKFDGLADKDRPLNKRGIQDAPMMALRTSKALEKTDLWLSSPATRAIRTAEIFGQYCNRSLSSLKLNEQLYDASYLHLITELRQIKNKWKNVVLFGHNPGLTDLIFTLTGEDLDNLPTCGMAFIEFALDDWSELASDTGKLTRIEYPKKYKQLSSGVSA
ncbi:phosphohistidine phosphatase SixA [Litoribrevibacter albus]|uniref:Phosphohistidine phosphatase SixA n=1 Tax=Litoribrevibacter albus TaxID=1473156 RepID=A0AA37SAW2_9GAMM|nr:phosphohistidine phosphatase SixA [Litoribrevibacter albus]